MKNEFDFDGKNETDFNAEKLKSFDDINSSPEQKHIDKEIKKNIDNKNRMKFIAGCVAAIVVAGSAYFLFSEGGEIRELKNQVSELKIDNQLKESDIDRLSDKIDELEKSGKIKSDVIRKLKEQLIAIRKGKLRNINRYVKNVQQYNNRITECAVAINSHINSNGNLKNASYLLIRCRDLRSQIVDDRSSFMKEYQNYGGKYYNLVREMFDLELTRIDGLVDGVDQGIMGGDFMPSFRSGTAAAYRFDDVEREFNRLPKP